MLTRRQDKAGYEATMGSISSAIVVGGRTLKPTEFLPAMNASFHNDEAWLDINHIDSVISSRTDTLRDGVIAHSNGFNHEFYIADGKLKWDVVYPDAASVPDTVRFRVRHSDNLSFYRQVLSQEAIDRGDKYTVPEAHNSFAVYFNNGRRDNKYQTGKVCHIYSPYYVDEAGARSPLLDMTLTHDIDNTKTLTLSHTVEVTEWLNDPARVGKMRLDPIIGYDTKGALSLLINPNILRNFNPHGVASISGEVTELNGYFNSANLITLAAYEADNSSPYYMFHPGGALYPLVAWGEAMGVLGGGVTAFTPTIVKSITAGQTYRIAINVQANTIVYYDNLVAFQEQYRGIAYSTPPPDPSGVGTNLFLDPATFSIWFVYAEIAEDVLMGGGLLDGNVLSGGSFGNFGGFGF